MDVYEKSEQLHLKNKGKISISSKVAVKNAQDLSLAYSPGVGRISSLIAQDKKKVYDYTSKGNMVAVVSDGSAVLGLGNVGPLAALPVMEGKAILFKEFGGVDSVPIVLDTQDDEEIIKIVKAISPTYGGINLEDIAAPRCFKINDALQDIGIPVFHDDQYGTAIVVYAALINATIVTKKNFEDLKVVINGAGAAGMSIAKILGGIGFDSLQKVKEIVMCDSKGIICKDRECLNDYKIKLLEEINPNNLKGDLSVALKDADVFIGVSKGGLLKEEMVKSMADKPIIFALANPIPEIMPDIAKSAGAEVIATGRSDFPNQVNNVLVFPGIFKGALRAGAKRITMSMMLASAKAIAKLVEYPTEDKILPSPFEEGLAEEIAKAVEKNV